MDHVQCRLQNTKIPVFIELKRRKKFYHLAKPILTQLQATFVVIVHACEGRMLLVKAARSFVKAACSWLRQHTLLVKVARYW